jgi:hypothetical protein
MSKRFRFILMAAAMSLCEFTTILIDLFGSVGDVLR